MFAIKIGIIIKPIASILGGNAIDENVNVNEEVKK